MNIMTNVRPCQLRRLLLSPSLHYFSHPRVRTQERHFRTLCWEEAGEAGETGETGEGPSEAREGGCRGGEGEDQHTAELLGQGQPAPNPVLDDGREDCEKHSPDQDYYKEVRPPAMSKYRFLHLILC